MGFDNTDPTARRRWEPEAQRERDAEILRLHRVNVTQRGIAERLGVSLGSVQHVLRREQKREQQQLEREISDELDALDLDLLAMYRRAWHELEYGTPEQQLTLREFHDAADAYWATHPAPDEHGTVSWRERCDAAMSDDVGTAADDW